MNRRTFVRRSVAGGVGLASVSVAASAKDRAEISSANIAPPPVFELDELTIAELQSGMASGKYSAQSLARQYLDRIDKVDKHGPAINSVLELNPDALSIASELDKERKAKGTRGPLHGIPVLIKDNIDTHDRMTTTAGSLALGGSIPLQDSSVAKKLREIVGEKLTEFITPSAGSKRRSRSRAIDDLPAPEGPTMPIFSPAATVNESPSCAARRPPG